MLVDQLRDDPENARRHSDEQVRHLANLVLRFGWTRPIMVDVARDRTIVVGHGAKRAAALIYGEGGRVHAAPGPDRGGAELPEGMVPVLDVSGWTEDERRAVNLSDNRSGEMSEWDDRRLAEQLAALVDSDLDPALIGYDQAEVDELLKSLAGPSPPDDFPEFDEDLPTEHKCPKCGYEWSGKAS